LQFYEQESNSFTSYVKSTTIRSKAKMNPDSVFPVAGGEAAAG
jgi:hypothetical protein